MTALKPYHSTTVYFLGVTFIFISVMVLVLLNPVILSPDSDGYLTAAIYRSPVYPIFLQLTELLLGSFRDIGIICFQTIFGLSASYYLTNALRKKIHIHIAWFLMLYAILVFPYASEQAIGNHILSEGLSYPLYLITVALLFKGSTTVKLKNLILAAVVLFTLLLTRTQFIFLVPIAIFICIRLFILNKNNKSSLYLSFLFLLLPFLTNLTDKSYHFFVHDHFVSSPWTGIHLLTPAIFTAEESDKDLYINPVERKYFTETYSILKRKGLNVHHKINSQEPDIDIYIENYSEIANSTLFYKGLDAVSDGEITNENFILLDVLTRSMTPELIWKNKLDWLKLYVMNFIHGFDSVILFFITIILFGYSSFLVLKKPTNSTKTILLFTACMLGNMAIVSIGMHTIHRFTFYNNWVIFLVLFILLDSFYIKKN